MTKVIKTQFGEVTLRNIMSDLGNTNLESGISLSFNEEVFAEIVGYSIDDFGNDNEDLTLIEELIKEFI